MEAVRTQIFGAEAAQPGCKTVTADVDQDLSLFIKKVVDAVKRKDDKALQPLFHTHLNTSLTAINDTFGRMDICVSNAALQKNAPVDEMTLDQWKRVIDVNLTGTFLCSREAIRQFKKQGIDRSISYACGKLIMISSVHDVIPWEGHANYAAAKGGMMLFMKSLAQEVAHLRIRVNSIAPGAIRTPMNVEKLTSPEIYEQQLLNLIPCKRIGEPEDVARLAVWLASDESDYIHGSTIYPDGGMLLYPGFIGAG